LKNAESIPLANYQVNKRFRLEIEVTVLYTSEFKSVQIL